MSRGEKKATRRWLRPRFSVRSLAIVVTLVCVYFGSWESMERKAHLDISLYARYREREMCGTHTVAPYVIKAAEFDRAKNKFTWNYYVFLPIRVVYWKPVKLPYEWDAQPGYPYHYTAFPIAPSMWMNDP